jgi:hypothetical protein
MSKKAPEIRFDKYVRIGYTGPNLQTGAHMSFRCLTKKGAKKPDPMSG